MGRITDMQKMEQERKKRKKNILLFVMLAIGVIIAILLNPIIGIIIGFFPIVINALLDVGKEISTEEEDLSKKVKEELAPKIIKLALPEAEYFPYDGIDEQQYIAAEYADAYSKYKSDDKIIVNSKIDESKDCQIEFAEIQLKNEEKDALLFVGMFGFMQLPKDVRSKVKISREGTYKKDYIFKVNITNEQFENVFDVMSPNKNLAAKILTDELIEKIMSLYNTYGYKMDINIIRNKLYVRVESGPIIKENNAENVIDRIVMEKRYSMLKALTELMRYVYIDISETGI